MTKPAACNHLQLPSATRGANSQPHNPPALPAHRPCPPDLPPSVPHRHVATRPTRRATCHVTRAA